MDHDILNKSIARHWDSEKIIKQTVDIEFESVIKVSLRVNHEYGFSNADKNAVLQALSTYLVSDN